MNSTTTHIPPFDGDQRRRGRRRPGFGADGHRDHRGTDGHRSQGMHPGESGERERRHRHGGFAPGGFGPRGARGRGFGPGFGPAGPRGRRARKGDVRAAILSLLAQAPANGYALIQAISEHSNGAWKPSPGSVYPTLAQLVDEGLIIPVDTAAARSDYRLTDAGEAYVAEHADELTASWNSLSEQGPLDSTGELFQSTAKLMGVLRQYASEASDEQKRAAATKLDELRREFYRTLGE